MGEEALRAKIRGYALVNALKFGGKANPKAVAGMAFSEDPSLKPRAAEVIKLAEDIVKEVNAMPLESQRLAAGAMSLPAAKERAKEPAHALPKLPNADKYGRIHVRFAPNPDSVIHLGNARAAILSDEYAKMYRGLFTLRFEDTSPSVKPPEPEAYENIKQDLEWLGVRWDEVAIQSDRLQIYYEYAERLIELGGAYICTCLQESFRKRISSKEACPCRTLSVEENLRRWRGMLDGSIKKGGAVMRVKTDISHPNPAIRDWPAMRIDTKPHPRLGTRFRVWPLYNFASGVDDHLMGITHILRGKEHEVNMIRQKYMYGYFGWAYPEAIHYGRLKIKGSVLSKSKIRQGILDGQFSDWSDPRLGTIAALRKRGFLPQTIRQLIIEVGVRPSEAMISWENLDSMNRKALDPVVRRYIFIPSPAQFMVEGIPKRFEAKIPLHPDHPEWGVRTFAVQEGGAKIAIQSADAESLRKGEVIRLMNLFNVEVVSKSEGRFHSEEVAEAKERGSRIIQWMPADLGRGLEVVRPDASRDVGVVDPAVLSEKLPSTFQFYRYGFVRVYKEGDAFRGYFAHG